MINRNLILISTLALLIVAMLARPFDQNSAFTTSSLPATVICGKIHGKMDAQINSPPKPALASQLIKQDTALLAHSKSQKDKNLLLGKIKTLQNILRACTHSAPTQQPQSTPTGLPISKPTAKVPADPRLGMYVQTVFSYGNLSFKEITLLPGGKAYQGIPNNIGGGVFEFDCSQIPKDQLQCGTFFVQGDSLTINNPDGTTWTGSFSFQKRENITIDQDSYYAYEKVEPLGNKSLTGDFYMAFSSCFGSPFSANGCSQSRRDVTFDPASKTFQASNFIGFLWNGGLAPGTPLYGEQGGALITHPNISGTYQLVGEDLIRFTLGDGTVTQERFFTLETDQNNKPVFIYVGAFGFLTPQ